ncbi:dTDP-4-dehydrorhamnose reductase [Cellulosimicrobium sp. NPDC057862]|uniref:dTDP-4-dehydrorhamnose reductase n=1 Tax=Cellulosimicrobium sp. NPDC057862 TaxID=3346266 RepID=UPI00366EAFC1
MRWLVTGAAGMLGTDVVAGLGSDVEVVALGRDDLDILSAPACRDILRPGDVLVNCAAWTDVDGAETHEAEAFAVNAVGAANLATAAAAVGARMVHVSTDYVFDGSADEPYVEGAPIRPVSAYGRTKAAGEWAVRSASPDHLVVRTAWLYGAAGQSFPGTIARLLRERGAVSVVDDQVGQPTWTVDVADVVAALVDSRAPGGTYHATSSGSCTWYEFARAVALEVGTDAAAVSPTTSEAFVRPAPRPAYSVLSHGALERAGVVPIGDWRTRWEAAAASVLPGARA